MTPRSRPPGARPGFGRSVAGRLALLAAVLMLVPVAMQLYGQWTAPSAGYDQVRAAKIRTDWQNDRDRRRADHAAMDAALIRVAVVGDSYTEGSGMGGVETQSNWTTTTARILWDQKRIPVVLDRYASGGSGYTVRGNRNIDFPELTAQAAATDPDMVVMFGSRNDMGRDGIRGRAAAAYAAFRQKAPQARLVVIGPPWTNENVPAEIVQVREEVRAAALAARADFFDPIQNRWFFGPDSEFIGEDQVHPTNEGHAYMGTKIADLLAGLLAERSIADAVPLS